MSESSAQSAPIGPSGMYVGDVPPWPGMPPAYMPGQFAPGRSTQTVFLKDTEAPTTMDILMIWVRQKDDAARTLWLEDAWDADTIDENGSGWDERVQKAYKEYGGDNVRIVRTKVNYDKIEAAFEPTEV